MEEKEEIKGLEEPKKKDKEGSLFKAVFISLLLVGLSVACGWFANSYFTENKNTAKQEKEEKIKKMNSKKKQKKKKNGKV